MFSAVVVFASTATSTASCRYLLVIARIARGMVAENSATCLYSGVPVENALDVLGEAHRQHLVGLVEHQVVELGQIERAALQVIDHAAGCTDDHLRTAAQPGELHAVGLTAVDRQHVDAGQLGAVATECLGDLQGELAGRRQHQRLRGLAGGVDLAEDRDRERGRLAGSGLGQTHDVGALRSEREWSPPGWRRATHNPGR